MDKDFDTWRREAVYSFSRIYKDSLAFDMAKVPKEIRVQLLQDEEYLAETRSLKAALYAKQLKTIEEVLDLEFSDTSKGSQAPEVLKALEMRDRLLFKDLNIDADESNALNIAFVALSREDYEALPTVEIVEGSNEGDFDPGKIDVKE